MSKLPRRPFQFSLRTLLIVVTLCALPCSWLAVRLREAEKPPPPDKAFTVVSARIETYPGHETRGSQDATGKIIEMDQFGLPFLQVRVIPHEVVASFVIACKRFDHSGKDISPKGNPNLFSDPGSFNEVSGITTFRVDLPHGEAIESMECRVVRVYHRSGSQRNLAVPIVFQARRESSKNQ